MRYKVAHGGRGSGKSHSFARMLLLSCLKAPERILCAREYQSSIKDSVKQLLDDIIDEYKLYSYFKSKQGEITGANGSKFLFAGLRHDPHKIKSMEGITKCWLEEANVVSQESLDFLIPTIRDEGSEIWMTFNRQHKSDPVDKMFLGEFKRPDATVARVNFSENPFFPNTLRLEMEWDKSHDIGKYEHIWLGKPVQHSDSLIFHGRYKMDETIIPPKGTPLYYGMDFGFSKDPFAFLRCWIDRSKREIYIDMEAYGIGIEINHLCKYIDAIPGSKHYSIKADSSRPDTISFLKNQGYNIIGSRKGKGSVHDGVEFLKSHTIIVHPRCKHLLDELSLYSYKVDKRTGTVMPDIEDKNNHMMDSLRYALEDFTQGTVEVFVG
ncbi:MAG: PBSX family phage terminase large subunit [Chloroflexota bacterium]|nr:MAG: PBSX family phage terminase large subunit [Chloroflexota bacterium]